MSARQQFCKTTRLKGTPGIFEHLGGQCDGTHTHANWKVQRLGPQWIFNTAAEAEYPRVLAERMVAAVVAKLPPHLFQQTIRRFRLDLLQQADKQHKLGEQLIPEYSRVSFMDELPLIGNFSVVITCEQLSRIRTSCHLLGKCLCVLCDCFCAYQLLF